MSSESVLEGSQGQSMYVASKNAVNSFTRFWSKELGSKGVRVVGVAPGILEATGLRTLSYEEALAYTRDIIKQNLYLHDDFFNSPKKRMAYVINRLMNDKNPVLTEDLAFEMSIRRTTLIGD